MDTKDVRTFSVITGIILFIIGLVFCLFNAFSAYFILLVISGGVAGLLVLLASTLRQEKISLDRKNIPMFFTTIIISLIIGAIFNALNILHVYSKIISVVGLIIIAIVIIKKLNNQTVDYEE